MKPVPSRVLIADHHPLMRHGVRSILETEEAWKIVGEAPEGREALRLARETKPDIAILELSLPQMNGVELTRAIKAEIPKTEVLIYTRHDRENIVSDVLRAGARSVVLKSDRGKDLLAGVEALARRQCYFSSCISERLLQNFLVLHEDDECPLTHRERETLQLIVEGQSNKQAAHTMGVSVKTLETHRSSVMRKLKLTTTAELVRYAVRHHIILP